jgi:D-glycero-D-manno-heptose 1,7-bisphosphate phosphatase
LQPKSVVFVDRDGVINTHRIDYVKSWDEFVFLPGTFEAFRKLAEMPHEVIVVTNQSAIGRGLVGKEIVEEINRRMVTEVQLKGGRIDDVIYCPHHPNAKCMCRKPNPGMIFRAATQSNLDLTSSYLIGDSPSDVGAAITAGCTPILVLTGRGQASQFQLLQQYPELDIAQNLLAAVEWILLRQQK